MFCFENGKEKNIKKNKDMQQSQEFIKLHEIGSLAK